jgi:hypothetical protein
MVGARLPDTCSQSLAEEFASPAKIKIERPLPLRPHTQACAGLHGLMSDAVQA